MKPVERIDAYPVRLGGEPHSGWLPRNAAVPPPTPTRDVELDLTIESDGVGFLLIYEARDGSLRGDTSHPTLVDAREQARQCFGMPATSWRRGPAV